MKLLKINCGVLLGEWLTKHQLGSQEEVAQILDQVNNIRSKHLN
jgi:hypothetical protein